MISYNPLIDHPIRLDLKIWSSNERFFEWKQPTCRMAADVSSQCPKNASRFCLLNLLPIGSMGLVGIDIIDENFIEHGTLKDTSRAFDSTYPPENSI